MLVHPLPMLMNAVRIDRDQPFAYDAYDITPSVARAVSALDRERLALVAALGGEVKPIEAILGDYYGVTGTDFFDVVRKVPAYKGSTAPKDFSHRYITEEVPTQIVPSCAIARTLGVETPMMEATTTFASAVAGETFAASGWTSERLGIARYDRTTLLRHLEAGL
jgi:opine dehydrogenase